MPSYDDDDDVKTAPTYDDDDDGWNSGAPIAELNCKGIFKGKVTSASFNDKGDGTGQLVLRIVPTSIVYTQVKLEIPEDELAAAVQRFSMYLSKEDASTLTRARKLCAALGSDTAANNKGVRVTTWARELDEAKPDVYFQMEQPKARPNYPNVDEDGKPIYQVSRVSAKAIQPKL